MKMVKDNPPAYRDKTKIQASDRSPGYKSKNMS